MRPEFSNVGRSFRSFFTFFQKCRQKAYGSRNLFIPKQQRQPALEREIHPQLKERVAYSAVVTEDQDQGIDDKVDKERY